MGVGVPILAQDSEHKLTEEKIASCRQQIEQIKIKQEQEEREKQRQVEIERVEAEKRSRKFKKTVLFIASGIILFLLLVQCVLYALGHI